MPTVKLANERLNPVYVQLGALLQWLRPGRAALKVARVRAAIEPALLSFAKESDRLIDELVVMEEVEGEKRRARKQHPNFPHIEVWDFGERSAEAQQRERELREDTVEVTVPALFTDADVERWEKERITSVPKDEGNPFVGVDLSVLLPFFDFADEAA